MSEMDNDAPPWFNQSRPAAGIPPWRGMYPPPSLNHYRTNNYEYYQQHHIQGGHQAWHDPRMNYYSQNPGNESRPVETRRPASRAEIYEKSDRREPYRSLSRQGYDERYGFYEAVHRENYGNRNYRYEPAATASAEKEWSRGTHNQHMEHWMQNPPNVYYADQIVEAQQNKIAQDRVQGYVDNNNWHSGRCSSAIAKIEPSFSSTEPSMLSQYRDSGMSSSSYELSQYMHDPADVIGSWNSLQDETLECTPQPTAPMKFSLPHVTVCFGARGQLVRVCPNFPDEGQPALVEIHSMEVLLSDTAEQEEMGNFPGPVQREDLHKVDVMNYCQQNASQCLRSGGQRSRDDALLWQVLLQMCRQNGCITGTDVAELLLQGCKRERYQNVQTDSDLISLTEDLPLIPDGTQVDLLTGEAPSATENSARAVEKFTKLLFFGRKKEALDWAMKSQLWGHALFLSSKMDSRTYSSVMARFTSTLALNDPLQTLFQLMAGRIPQAASWNGDSNWGDWRPHLAIMLSNQMGEPEVNKRAIVTMGDHLVLKGFTEAGHCCYLTAGIPLGQFYEKSDRLVLLGSNQNQTFRKFASTANIQRTEILEYCQSLGKPSRFVPSFQVYKFLYATRLLDYGLTSLALHYCECIAYALLSSDSGSSVLISELIKLAGRLRYSDPQILERPETEQNQEPLWLVQLHALLLQFQTSNGTGRISPVTCNDQANKTEAAQQNKPVEVSDLPSSGEGLHKCLEDETGHSLQKAAEEQDYIGSWVPRDTHLPVVDAQSGYNYAWSSKQNTLSAELAPDYNTPEEPHAQETLEEFSESPTHSSNNALIMQDALMFRRVSTVSEASTISVEDDNGEERSNDEALEQKPEEKKGSTFGWFSWFRSGPTKEIQVPPRNPQTTNSSYQADSPPRDGNTFPPPTSGYLPQDNPMNPSSQGKKESEDRQKINSGSVLPDIRGQQENMGIYPNASVTGSHMSQLPGAVPLYNPSQFLQNKSQGSNLPSRLQRVRYSLPPR
ncbi:PREDICTED: protein transport protein Sec16B [Nanorana parkeri]|uniref:protein transport protein Sec16B n=1 Tax=Nanorana parkeri TaxID=125878 RepID=UPI0008547BF2|nr:PREDICTED: protein transport protein Sec16B [Nanorana parkeri]